MLEKISQEQNLFYFSLLSFSVLLILSSLSSLCWKSLPSVPLVGSGCIAKLFASLEQENYFFFLNHQIYSIKKQMHFQEDIVINTYYLIVLLKVEEIMNAFSLLTGGKNLCMS